MSAAATAKQELLGSRPAPRGELLEPAVARGPGSRRRRQRAPSRGPRQRSLARTETFLPGVSPHKATSAAGLTPLAPSFVALCGKTGRSLLNQLASEPAVTIQA